MENQLPLFEFIIDESTATGVKAVSIVMEPAFGSAAIRFDEDAPKPKFVAFGEKKQQIIAGFLILANTPVYRVDPEFGEYMGFFSPETITKIIEKYHEEMLTNQVNLDHNNEAYIDAFMIEDYQVNTKERVADLAAKGLKHPQAFMSWYGALKIKDTEVFNAIDASGEMTGFSVEAFLDRVMVDFNAEVKNNIIQLKVKEEMAKNNKTIKERILAIFTDDEATKVVETKLEQALVPELALDIQWGEIGEPVMQVVPAETEDGEPTYTPIGQGEFVTDMGIIVVDESSNLVEVRELPAEIVEEPVVEDELAVDEDGNPIEVPAPSGDTETIAEDAEIVVPENPTEPSATGVTETVTPTLGIDKSILEIVGTNRGEFVIIGFIDEEGNVVEAVYQSMQDLLLESQTKIDSLSAENAELLEKMKEPITDPILTPEPTPLEWDKMTVHQKYMHKKKLEQA